MSDEPNRDLRAIIEGDLLASGAVTVDEFKSALSASIDSLLSEPEIVVLPLSEDDKRNRMMRVSLTMPKLPVRP
jgi:hypothetical protein